MYSTAQTVLTRFKLISPETIDDSPYKLELKTLEASYDYCMSVMKENSKSFYFSSRYLPEEKRKSVGALYAFCRFTDDLVDESNLPESEITHELDMLKMAVKKLSEGHVSIHPILNAFGDTIRKFNIPIKYMHELIEGVRMDLTKTEYFTEDELKLYSYRVASVVGIMMCYIFGSTNERTLARAADLGHAMQLTNILRDIKEDYEEKNRIYLPLETRQAYGVTEEDLKSREISPNLKKLIEYEIARAKGIYKLSELGIADLPPYAAFTISVAGKVYGEILEEIKRKNYEVLKARTVVSKRRKIWIALKLRLKYLKRLGTT